MMKSLRELYNLSYDKSGLNSGLIQWYNNMIDKSIDELKVADISKMIRQDILLDIAIKKAIELFFCDPYDGEYQDGELLSLLLTLNMSRISEDKLKELNFFLQSLKTEYINFDWDNKKIEEQYAKDLDKLEVKITKFVFFNK